MRLDTFGRLEMMPTINGDTGTVTLNIREGLILKGHCFTVFSLVTADRVQNWEQHLIDQEPSRVQMTLLARKIDKINFRSLLHFHTKLNVKTERLMLNKNVF